MQNEASAALLGLSGFRKGTLIGTPCGGLTPIEELRAGDLIATADLGPQKIVMVTHGDHSAEAVAVNPALRPFLLGMPEDGLYVSRHQGLLVSLQDGEEVLISAFNLARCCRPLCREIVSWSEGVEWFNILTERHSIIMADGYPVATGYLGFMHDVVFAGEWRALSPLPTSHRAQPARRFVLDVLPDSVQA